MQETVLSHLKCGTDFHLVLYENCTLYIITKINILIFLPLLAGIISRMFHSILIRNNH